MEAPNATPSEEVQPFQVMCPTCGRHSEAGENDFLFIPAMPFLGSGCLLAGLTYTASGTRVDRTLWPVDAESL